MSTMHDWSGRFSKAIADGTLDACFDEWVQTASEHYSYPEIANGGQECVPNEPGLYLWGADRTVDGKRRIVPRYVGKSKGRKLQRRFVSRTGCWDGGRGRYVLAPDVSPGNTPPQGTIACRFYDNIRDAIGNISNSEYANTLKPWRKGDRQSPAVRGLEAFPPSLVASFRRKSSTPGWGATLRLRHAVDWALHGGQNLEHLWAAFLPSIAELEKQLIDAAIRWRTKYGLPPLLNSEDKS